MQFSVVVALLFFVGVALCAPRPPFVQANLYPVYADGIETVWLDDMSFVTEISIQTWGPNGSTCYIYGDSRLRTVYLGEKFYVGSTPNENWFLPFIDFHTFQNGSDIWGVGPVNAMYGQIRGPQYSGFQFQIAIITNASIPNLPRGRFFTEPVGYEGTFYSTRVVSFGIDATIAYFVGFYPTNSSTPNILNFGVRRAHLNASMFENGDAWNQTNQFWSFDRSVDDAPILVDAQLVAYNNDFKPFLLHARNVSGAAPNTTHLVVVDPYTNFASLVVGNIDQTVPISYTGQAYIPHHPNVTGPWGQIVSAAIWQDIVIVGVSVDGQGTGWLDFLSVSTLAIVGSVYLPTNMSDPRALVIDYTATTPTLYVGMNGGWAALRVDINSMKITGYQAVPFYLHRTWRGQATPYHIYFVTNEQHAKVYRISKDDFCPQQCMEFGYCYKGRCVCGPNMILTGDRCEWRQLVVEKNIAKKEKGGEIALGIFFAIATVAAIAGWYMVWKNKRGYQAVA